MDRKIAEALDKIPSQPTPFVQLARKLSKPALKKAVKQYKQRTSNT